MKNDHDLFGRARVVDFVVDCLGRAGHDQRSDVPFVLLLGSRGSGKSALLEWMRDDERFSRAPRVLLDMERADLEPRQLISKVAFGLERRSRGYGPVRFPRLRLCGLVLGEPDLNVESRRMALRQISQRIREDSALHRSRESIGGILKLLESVMNLPAGLAQSVAGVVLPAASHVWLRWRVGERWKAIKDGNAFDDLVDLYVSDGGDEVDRAEVDEALCVAFLADLADAVHDGVRAALARPVGCLVLLDNINSRSAEQFLDLVARVRQGRVAREAPCDPMVVVATSRSARTIPLGGSVKAILPSGNAEIVQSDDANYDGWYARLPGESATRSDRRTADWWYPVALRDLTGLEVGRMVRAAGLGWIPQLSTTLYRLTAGHPATTRIVIDALRQHLAEGEPGAGLPDLRFLLELPVAGTHGSPTVGDLAVCRWLDGLDMSTRDALVTSSASPSFIQDPIRAGNGELDHEVKDISRSCLLQKAWWAPEAGLGSAPLHPGLRRLLTRALARRGDDHADSWYRVHDRLRVLAAGDPEGPDAAYHTLALGDVEAVTTRLQGRLHEIDADLDAWIAELRAICKAPLRIGDQLVNLEPREQADHLANRAGHSQESIAIAHLVAALWIRSDPLGDPDNKLVTIVHNKLTFLSRQVVGRGMDVLQTAAEVYLATHDFASSERPQKDPASI